MIWRQVLETYGFRLSRSKTDCMESNVSKRQNVSSLEVKVRDHTITQVTLEVKVRNHTIAQVTWYKYLRSMI